MQSTKTMKLYVPLSVEQALEVLIEGLAGLRGMYCSRRKGFVYSTTNSKDAWTKAVEIATSSKSQQSIVLTVNYRKDFDLLMLCAQGNLEPITIWSGTVIYLSDRAIECLAHGGRNCPPAKFSMDFKPLV